MLDGRGDPLDMFNYIVLFPSVCIDIAQLSVTKAVQSLTVQLQSEK